ncbi:MAG TPA: membrane protein insertase YidC [Thermoanaerobaculia bacterium]|nr:membrane protein insertase YidC [Thermoanaerobaculia bacterium]
MDNRRLLLVAALSLAILFSWQLIFPPPEPPAPVAEPAQPVAVEPVAAAPPQVASPLPAPGTAPESAAPTQPVAAATETRVIVETPEVRAEFTNRGAQLVSYRLKGSAGDGPEGLELVAARRDGPYPFALVRPDGAPLALNDALFAAEETAEGPARTVRFRHAGPAGAAEKLFRFLPNGTFEVEITASGAGDWALVLGPGLRNPSLKDLESRFEVRAGVYLYGDELGVYDARSEEEPLELAGGGLRWVGLEDTYFLTVLAPETPVERALLQPLVYQPGEPGAEGQPARFSPLPPEAQRTKEQEKAPRAFLLIIEPKGERFAAGAYFGPKEYTRLAALPWELEKTVRWGTFGFFARILLVALRWIHDHLVANYGWAIVLLTVAINLLLLPLTHKSYVSMRKMQDLNPKIQAIRERWRPKLKDKQGKPNLEAQRKMQEEMNALFKSQGVNPAGGCLPLLLQLPVLWAFYNLLSTAIELRGAPWMGWIRDLSAADPYYVLPIVMGGTQWLQARMTPTTADPMQRRLFQLMPLLFTVLFLGFPSGLVLYWLTNNVLNIARQAVYNELRKREETRSEAPSEKTRRTAKT